MCIISIYFIFYILDLFVLFSNLAVTVSHYFKLKGEMPGYQINHNFLSVEDIIRNLLCDVM